MRSVHPPIFRAKSSLRRTRASRTIIAITATVAIRVTVKASPLLCPDRERAVRPMTGNESVTSVFHTLVIPMTDVTGAVP